MGLWLCPSRLTLLPHIVVLASLLPVQFPTKGKAAGDGPSGPYNPHGRSTCSFLAPGYYLVQSQLLWPFEKWIRKWIISLCVCVTTWSVNKSWKRKKRREKGKHVLRSLVLQIQFSLRKYNYSSKITYTMLWKTLEMLQCKGGFHKYLYFLKNENGWNIFSLFDRGVYVIY